MTLRPGLHPDPRAAPSSPSRSRSRKKRRRGSKGKKRKEWYAERHPEGVRPKPPPRRDDDEDGPGD